MDIGIVGGYRISDKELFKGFRIMGKAMYQGLEQNAVLDIDTFILVHTDPLILEDKHIPLFLKFVAPDVTRIHY